MKIGTQAPIEKTIDYVKRGRKSKAGGGEIKVVELHTLLDSNTAPAAPHVTRVGKNARGKKEKKRKFEEKTFDST